MQRKLRKLTTFHPYCQGEADLRFSRGGADLKFFFKSGLNDIYVKVHHFVFPTSPKAPYTRGGFRGGGEGGGGGGTGLSFPSGIRPPAHPKGPPFVLFWDLHFLADWPYNFFKRRLWRQNVLNWEARAKKKTIFLVERFFRKVPI